MRSLLALGFLALPALAAAALILRFGVDVPYWDEWLFVPFLERVGQGRATLDDWLAPNNEHVVLVPKLLLAALAFTVGWNAWFGMAAGLLFAAGTVAALRRLGRDSRDVFLQGAAELATGLLVFSLVQWENWLWGIQSAWFLANLCVALALVTLRPAEGGARPRQIALAAALCFVATLTIAPGPFSWLVMLPLVAWGHGEARARARALTAWLGLTGAAWGVLLLGLRHVRHPPTFEAALREPMAAGRFFLAILGTPLATSPDLALMLGVLLVAALVGLAVAGLRGPDRALALPWCALGAFGVMVAAVTALARVNQGLDYALSSRYTTNAVLVWVAVWSLARLRLQALRPRARRWGTVAMLGGLAIGLGATSRAAIESANAEYLWRSGGKACLELGSLLEPTPLNEGSMLYLFMRPAGVPRRFETLVRLGVRQPRPRPSFETSEDPRVGLLTQAPAADGPTPGRDLAAGWVVVENQEHPPILLLSVNEGRSFVAAQQLVEGVSPRGIRVRFRSRDVALWEVPLEANGPRPLGGSVSAWRFDPGANVIVRLGSAVSAGGPREN